jgi:hypothetical protein
LNKKLRIPSCKRKSRRWPMAVFSNLIDVSTSNGSYVYGVTHGITSSSGHMDCLKNAGYQLVDALIRKRIQAGHLKASTSEAMKAIGYALEQTNFIAVEHTSITKLTSRIRCHYCPRESDKKTTTACPRCRKPRCQNHQSQLCCECAAIVS